MDFPVIQGRRFSWPSVELKSFGQIYTGYTSINWKQGVKSTKVMAAGAYPVGRTLGEYEASGDIEWLVQDAQLFKAMLAARHPTGSYALVPFDLALTMSEDAKTDTITLVQCRIEEEDVGASRGPDAITEKWTLSIMWILKNGLRMLSPEDAGR